MIRDMLELDLMNMVLRGKISVQDMHQALLKFDQEEIDRLVLVYQDPLELEEGSFYVKGEW